jgi:hypothetical protein
MRIPKPRQQANRLLPFVFIGLFLCAAMPVFADVACTPTVPLPDQHRTAMKHRVPPPGIAAQPATVADMLAWPLPEGMTRKKRKNDTVMDPREDKAYVVEAVIWRVKLAEDDCDLHLEIGTPGGAKRDERAIIEIPQGQAFLPAREALIAGIPKAGELKPKEALPMLKPVLVRITGYAFCDLQHYTPKDLKRGTGHGGKSVATLWEIHPVWKIEFLKK